MLLRCYNDVISNTFYCSTAFVTEVTEATSVTAAVSTTTDTSAARATLEDSRLGFPFVGRWIGVGNSGSRTRFSSGFGRYSSFSAFNNLTG